MEAGRDGCGEGGDDGGVEGAEEDADVDAGEHEDETCGAWGWRSCFFCCCCWRGHLDGSRGGDGEDVGFQKRRFVGWTGAHWLCFR